MDGTEDRASGAGAAGDLSYVRATASDMDLLVSARSEVMRAVWGLPDSEDMAEYERQTRDYYARAIPAGTHTAILAEDESELVGVGGISYYRVMPTVGNPTGRKAYVMNMYVRPGWRRRGVATRLLQLLLDDAARRGVTFVSLEASEDGRPLYARSGFEPMPDEMLLRQGGRGAVY